MMRRETDRRLEQAVETGIITAAQAAAIRALGPADEAPRPAATIAYLLGAITVVVAMGWFLADRWKWLGPWGVLAVVAVYAGLFLITARVLRREGFEAAAGLAVLLAVLLTPIATLAVNELTGWFDGPPFVACGHPGFIFLSCRGLEMVAELATAAAALFALRRVRFSMLVLPLAVVALRMLFHLADALGRQGYGDATSGWIWMIGASAMAASAYVTDRKQRGDEDFAFWMHAAAAVSAMAAAITLTQPYPVYRHLLVPGALVAFALALTIRRRAWAILGIAWFVWHLGWLASEYFRDTPAFPIVLAALGLGVIVGTVWVQRNSTRLVERFGTVTDDGRPRFPGGVPLLLAPILVAVLMMPDGRRLDRERQAEMEWRNARWQRQMRREAAAKARADSLAPRRETAPLKQP